MATLRTTASNGTADALYVNYGAGSTTSTTFTNVTFLGNNNWVHYPTQDFTMNIGGLSGIEGSLIWSGGKDAPRKGSEPGIHPRLYFKYVKSKFTKVQKERLRLRLDKLKLFIKSAEVTGQRALYEEFAKQIAICVREQELAVIGIDYHVPLQAINRFMNRVKGVTIRLDKVEDFPRPMPADVVKKFEKVKKLGMFDEYFVLHADHHVDKPVKTTEKKIIEKDPILFGKLNLAPENLYVIADWEDEFCDLTLKKLVDKISTEDKTFKLAETDDLTREKITELIEAANASYDRLKNTNRGNFKVLAKEDKEFWDKKAKSKLKTIKDIITREKNKN